MLAYLVSMCLNVQETETLFFKVVLLCCISFANLWPSSCKELLFFNRSNICVIVSDCSLKFVFTNDQCYIFMCLFAKLRIFFHKLTLQIFCLFSICLYSYYWFLWIFLYGHMSFNIYVIREYFLPVCHLSFNSLNSVFQRVKILNFCRV